MFTNVCFLSGGNAMRGRGRGGFRSACMDSPRYKTHSETVLERVSWNSPSPSSSVFSICARPSSSSKVCRSKETTGTSEGEGKGTEATVVSAASSRATPKTDCDASMCSGTSTGSRAKNVDIYTSSGTAHVSSGAAGDPSAKDAGASLYGLQRKMPSTKAHGGKLSNTTQNERFLTRSETIVDFDTNQPPSSSSAVFMEVCNSNDGASKGRRRTELSTDGRFEDVPSYTKEIVRGEGGGSGGGGFCGLFDGDGGNTMGSTKGQLIILSNPRTSPNRCNQARK